MFEFQPNGKYLFNVYRPNGFNLGFIRKNDGGKSDWIFCSNGFSLDVADMIQICNKINELENKQ